MLKRCALLLLTLPNLLMASNGPANIGPSVKSRGMGGVAIAYPQDSLAGVANPAGLAHVGSRVDVGLMFDYYDAAQLIAFEGDVGISWEFCPGQTVGLADTPYGGLYSRFVGGRSYYMAEQLVPCWSWRINPCHSVGFSFPIVLASFERKGEFPFVPIGSLFPNDRTNKGIDLGAGVALQVGWLGQLSQRLAVGATYRTRTWMSRFEKYQGFFPEQGDADLPPMVGVGAAWRLTPCCLIAAEVDHYFWQQVRWLGNALLQGGAFGSDEGPGFGWSDQTVAKVGVEWAPLRCLALRMGYNYGKQPIAPTETLLNLLTLATVEHHLTAGLSWRICRYEVSAFYSYGFRNQVDGRNSLAVAGSSLEVDLANREQAGGISIGNRF